MCSNVTVKLSPSIGWFPQNLYLQENFFIVQSKILHLWLWCSWCVTFMQARVTINSTTYKYLTIKFYVHQSTKHSYFMWCGMKVVNGIAFVVRDWTVNKLLKLVHQSNIYTSIWLGNKNFSANNNKINHNSFSLWRLNSLHQKEKMTLFIFYNNIILS